MHLSDIYVYSHSHIHVYIYIYVYIYMYLDPYAWIYTCTDTMKLFLKSFKHCFSYMSMLKGYDDKYAQTCVNVCIHLFVCLIIKSINTVCHRSAISGSKYSHRHIFYIYLCCNFQSNVGVPDRQYLWLLTRQKPTMKVGGKYLEGVPSDGVSRRVKPVEDGGGWGD
jgi:hypothetical protein